MIVVPLWVGVAIVVIGGIAWLYDLAVARPRRKRELAARKHSLYGPTDAE